MYSFISCICILQKQYRWTKFTFLKSKYTYEQEQSDLPRPIPWNSVESDLGCTSRIYFDNVTLTLHNVTLASQKPCQHNNKCDRSKTNGLK